MQTCEGCASPFHLECWRDELDEKCTTLGCANEKPARGQRRFHALRGRLRRRRRRRLLDGEMSSTSSTGTLFVLGVAVASVITLSWMAASLDGEDWGFVFALGIPAALAAWIIYAQRQRSDRESP